MRGCKAGAGTGSPPRLVQALQRVALQPVPLGEPSQAPQVQAVLLQRSRRRRDEPEQGSEGWAT